MYKDGQRDDSETQHARTPFQLLRAAHRGDRHAGEMWAEYARAVDGQRLTTTTAGLKAFASLTPDGEDEQLVEPALTGELLHTFTEWEKRGCDVIN